MVSLPIAAIMGLGGTELLVILIILLVLFGGSKLPSLARGMGQSIKEFKKASKDAEDEIQSAVEDDEAKPVAKKPATPAKPEPR